MPKKGGTITPQERQFIDSYAKSGNVLESAKNAGYTQPSAGYRALNRPGVNAEIVRAQTERLNNHLLPLAINALERLLIDKRTPAGAVVQAAKLVMDRTIGSESGESGKAPHEMTGDELARQLERLRQEAAIRSKPVIDAQNVPNVLD
jgi:hypothetical protein